MFGEVKASTALSVNALQIDVYQPGGYDEEREIGDMQDATAKLYSHELVATAFIAQEEEAYFSVVFHGSFMINDLGGNNHRYTGVGLDGPNWRFADDHGAPGHDGDPCAVDDGQWNQKEEFYYDDQEEDIDIYDITEHDDGHDDGRDFDDDD